MFRLYIKNDKGVYEGPSIFKTFEETVSHAKGEYLIIKHENNRDKLIKYQGRENFKDEEDER